MSPCSRGVSIHSEKMPDVKIRPLDGDHHPEAASIITDALLNDPGWLAVGPKRAAHRRFVAERYHRAALRVTVRYGGPIYGAFRDDKLAGVAVTFPPGAYPPPRHTEARYVLAFLAAGPGPIVRGVKTGSVQDGGHPEDPHVYLWFLAVDPAHQRGGVGRALLARVCEDAQAPVYLDTSNPDNVPYYAANGFEEIGRGVLPRNTPMWFMRRP
jgi:ribosomal protein S18 acetylase RimI-like enzyme